MNIIVIGAGAMGSIYGGRLSQENSVTLVDTNASLVDKIGKDGIVLEENGEALGGKAVRRQIEMVFSHGDISRKALMLISCSSIQSGHGRSLPILSIPPQATRRMRASPLRARSS